MGKVRYGKDTIFDVDDRQLVHLGLVRMTKMRRGESFALHLPDPNRVGSRSIWLAPAVSVEFAFAMEQPDGLDGRWVDAMMTEASSPNGLVLRPGLAPAMGVERQFPA